MKVETKISKYYLGPGLVVGPKESDREPTAEFGDVKHQACPSIIDIAQTAKLPVRGEEEIHFEGF